MTRRKTSVKEKPTGVYELKLDKKETLSRITCLTGVTDPSKARVFKPIFSTRS